MIACRLLIFSFFDISMHNFQQTKLGKDFTNPTIDFYCNFSFYAISLTDRRGFINDGT